MTKSKNKAKKKSLFLFKKWIIGQGIILAVLLIYGFYNSFTNQGNLAFAVAAGMFISFLLAYFLSISEDIKDLLKHGHNSKSEEQKGFTSNTESLSETG